MASMSLAALEGVDMHAPAALKLLATAQEAGAPTAKACADSMSRDPATREGALDRLRAAAVKDSDALNFLGIAAFTSDRLDSATEVWTTSVEFGDAVAPLLLRRVPTRQTATSPE